MTMQPHDSLLQALAREAGEPPSDPARDAKIWQALETKLAPLAAASSVAATIATDVPAAGRKAASWARGSLWAHALALAVGVTAGGALMRALTPTPTAVIAAPREAPPAPAPMAVEAVEAVEIVAPERPREPSQLRLKRKAATEPSVAVAPASTSALDAERLSSPTQTCSQRERWWRKSPSPLSSGPTWVRSLHRATLPAP